MSNHNPVSQKFDPMTFKLDDTEVGDAEENKSCHPEALYDNLQDYQRIPADQYFSTDFMKKEWDKMWTRTWLCAGRLSDLPGQGSYFRYDIGPESFIIVRGHDDKIRAFYNVCPHRARQLVENECGATAEFVCPHHSWAFDLSGQCTRVTDQEVFSSYSLCGDISLKSVRCETWGGFVFINMDPSAQDLLEYLGPIARLLEPYRLEEMYVVKDSVLPIKSNWKVGLDIFLEAYHLHSTHPQALGGTEDYYIQTDVYENGHGRQISPIGVPSVRFKDRKKINALLRYIMEDAGMNPDDFKGSATDVREALNKHKRRPDNKYGMDYSRFSPSQVTDDWNFFIFPNMTLNTHPEGVLIIRFLPHASDPELFYFHVLIIVPKLKEGCTTPFYMGLDKDADISGKIRPARIYTSIDNPKMGEVLDQDIGNMEATQRGLRSRSFTGGMRFGNHELRDMVMHAELDKYLRGEK